MKYALALAALVAMIGFVGFAHAKDPAKPKVVKGHFLKVEDKVVTFKGGVKGKGAEHTVKIDDSTKITLDGKEAKLADIKADTYIEVTELDGTASLIAASSVIPTEVPKTQPAPKSPDAPKAPDAAK